LESFRSGPWRCTSAAATNEIGGRAELEQGIIGRLNTLDTWDGVKDDVFLLPIIVSDNSVKGEFTQIDDGAVLRPVYSDIIDSVSFIRKLHMELEGNGPVCDALWELIKEEAWGYWFYSIFVEMLDASVWHDAIVSETNSSLAVDELYCMKAEVAFSSEAGRRGFWCLYEGERSGMGSEECFDRSG